MLENRYSYYVDQSDYTCRYLDGHGDLTVLLTGEIYHCFNGFLKLSVL